MRIQRASKRKKPGSEKPSLLQDAADAEVVCRGPAKAELAMPAPLPESPPATGSQAADAAFASAAAYKALITPTQSIVAECTDTTDRIAKINSLFVFGSASPPIEAENTGCAARSKLRYSSGKATRGSMGQSGAATEAGADEISFVAVMFVVQSRYCSTPAWMLKNCSQDSETLL